MRTYLKSLGSFSWILSLFGLKQLGELLMAPVRRRPRAGGEVLTLTALTRSLEEHLGPTFQAVFRSGDRILQGLMNFTLGRERRWKPRTGAGTPPWQAEAPGFPGAPSAGSPPPPGATPGPAPSPGSPPVSGWGPMPPVPEPPAADRAADSSARPAAGAAGPAGAAGAARKNAGRPG